jgi:hypothetical protein
MNCIMVLQTKILHCSGKGDAIRSLKLNSCNSSFQLLLQLIRIHKLWIAIWNWVMWLFSSTVTANNSLANVVDCYSGFHADPRLSWKKQLVTTTVLDRAAAWSTLVFCCCQFVLKIIRSCSIKIMVPTACLLVLVYDMNELGRAFDPFTLTDFVSLLLGLQRSSLSRFAIHDYLEHGRRYFIIWRYRCHGN